MATVRGWLKKAEGRPFTYTVKVGGKTNDDYPITMTVAANFPKQRIPAPDEKPEDKTKADAAMVRPAP